jgi:hypothetical protein
LWAFRFATLTVGLFASTPQALVMGLMVASSSFLRSLCRSLFPKAPAYAEFPQQSLTHFLITDTADRIAVELIVVCTVYISIVIGEKIAVY